MKTGKLCAMALAVGLVLMASSQAKAYWGWGCGYGFGYGDYGIGNIPTPPYFALHPPVYYGQIVHRSYGLSPFPYPGYTTPVRAPRPQVVINQHVEEEEAAGLEAAATWRPKPLLVINPYVQTTDSALAQDD